MISFRGLKQITKHLFFLLQISERCPSVCEVAKEEVEEDPSIHESAKVDPSTYELAKEDLSIHESAKQDSSISESAKQDPSVHELAEEVVEEEEESAKEVEEEKEEEIAEAVPSGLKVTSVDLHNQEACR